MCLTEICFLILIVQSRVLLSFASTETVHLHKLGQYLQRSLIPYIYKSLIRKTKQNNATTETRINQSMTSYSLEDIQKTLSPEERTQHFLKLFVKSPQRSWAYVNVFLLCFLLYVMQRYFVGEAMCVGVDLLSIFFFCILV